MFEDNDPLFQLEGAPPAITTLAVEPLAGIVERSLILDGGVSSITMVQGIAIGEHVAGILRIYVAQLRLPTDFRLRHGYDPDADPGFAALKMSIKQTQINLEPLICEVSGETIEIDGQHRPILLVRSGERRYHALIRLGLPDALVRVLPQETAQRMTLLFSLILNEMREPLSILDKCDIVAMLTSEYSLRQKVIAEYIGHSQSYVSRLNMAASQPPLIRTYLANEAMTLETIETLNKRIGDTREREMVARYLVQEGIQNGHIADIINVLAPPNNVPLARLELQGGEVAMIPIDQQAIVAKGREKTIQLVSPRPYWKRSAPLWAVPSRIVTQRHDVRLSGTPDAPKVEAKSLHITQLFEMIRKSKTEMIDAAAIEEAMLSDLDAIQAAYLAMPQEVGELSEA